MTKRRSLSSGIKLTKAEEEFLHRSTPKRTSTTVPNEEQPNKTKTSAVAAEENRLPPEAPPASSIAVEAPAQQPTSRAPLTTRIRADLAAALKQASLKRQLAGQEPNTLQEILEEALEPWLKSHGYLQK